MSALSSLGFASYNPVKGERGDPGPSASSTPFPTSVGIDGQVIHVVYDDAELNQDIPLTVGDLQVTNADIANLRVSGSVTVAGGFPSANVNNVLANNLVCNALQCNQLTNAAVSTIDNVSVSATTHNVADLRVNNLYANNANNTIYVGSNISCQQGSTISADTITSNTCIAGSLQVLNAFNTTSLTATNSTIGAITTSSITSPSGTFTINSGIQANGDVNCDNVNTSGAVNCNSISSTTPIQVNAGSGQFGSVTTNQLTVTGQANFGTLNALTMNVPMSGVSSQDMTVNNFTGQTGTFNNFTCTGNLTVNGSFNTSNYTASYFQPTALRTVPYVVGDSSHTMPTNVAFGFYLITYNGDVTINMANPNVGNGYIVDMRYTGSGTLHLRCPSAPTGSFLNASNSTSDSFDFATSNCFRFMTYNNKWLVLYNQ